MPQILFRSSLLDGVEALRAPPALSAGSYKARGSTQNERVGYSKALQTPQEHIIKLRKALVNDNGTDKGGRRLVVG